MTSGVPSAGTAAALVDREDDAKYNAPRWAGISAGQPTNFL